MTFYERYKDIKEQARWTSEKNIPRKGSSRCKGPMGGVCEGVQGTEDRENIIKDDIDKTR